MKEKRPCPQCPWSSEPCLLSLDSLPPSAPPSPAVQRAPHEFRQHQAQGARYFNVIRLAPDLDGGLESVGLLLCASVSSSVTDCPGYGEAHRRGHVWECLALLSAFIPRGNQWLSLWLLFPGLPGDSHLSAQIHPPPPPSSWLSPKSCAWVLHHLALLPVVLDPKPSIEERGAERRHLISEVVNSTLDFQKKITHLSNIF